MAESEMRAEQWRERQSRQNEWPHVGSTSKLSPETSLAVKFLLVLFLFTELIDFKQIVRQFEFYY